jgi:hypothetical protein
MHVLLSRCALSRGQFQLNVKNMPFSLLQLKKNGISEHNMQLGTKIHA